MEIEGLIGELQDLRNLVDGMTPQERGHRFERWLNQLLRLGGLDPRSRYRPSGEEIDGSFALDGRIYLFEAKWTKEGVPASSIYAFKGKVDGKLVGTIGFFISMAGFSEDSLDAVALGKELNVILVNDEDLEEALAHGIRPVLVEKLRAAAEYGSVFYPIRGRQITATGSALSVATVSFAPEKVLIVVEGRMDREIVGRVSQLLLQELGVADHLGVDIFSAGGVAQVPRTAAALVAAAKLAGAPYRASILVIDGDNAGASHRALLESDEFVGDMGELEVVVAEPSLAVDWLGKAPRSLDGLVSEVAKLRSESLVELRKRASFRKFEAAIQST